MNISELEIAYKDGIEAHNNGLELEDNPYFIRELSDQWDMGYMDAYADYK